MMIRRIVVYYSISFTKCFSWATHAYLQYAHTVAMVTLGAVDVCGIAKDPSFRKLKAISEPDTTHTHSESLAQ